MDTNDIVEEYLDLSVFEHRYHNDATGRLAYDPKVLLKIVLYGYYRGFVSSRRIAEVCCGNVAFMALSADSRPHFTTIAGFVSRLNHEIASLFDDVLLYASELGLIGKEHFAIDGCKLPSNASKKWSGTHKELDEKRKKLEQRFTRAPSIPLRAISRVYARRPRIRGRRRPAARSPWSRLRKSSQRSPFGVFGRHARCPKRASTRRHLRTGRMVSGFGNTPIDAKEAEQ